LVFDTPEFFVFFVIVLGLYYVLNHRWQNILLVASSYFFYGWFDWRFCGLLAFSTVLDWYCGLKIPGPHGRKWLYLSVIGQLAMLGFFKYYNFFEENFERLFAAIGWQVDGWTLNVVLPLGISFYTFQTLSYTIDVGRGQLKPVRNLIDFAAFVAFWPHLVAGPILRASYMLPQIMAPRRVDTRLWSEGTYFVIVGLVKKVAVADVIGNWIEGPVANPGDYSSWTLLLTAYMFAIRIYRYCPGRVAFHGFPPAGEFPVAIFLCRHNRILAPVAHLAGELAARLPVHSAGRQPARVAPPAGQPHHYIYPLRAMAQAHLELYPVGFYQRRVPVHWKVVVARLHPVY
jgi:D-alanyl-lipoteichoic acid acyltransferase DltB (MBOAT superfamily)